MNNYHVKKIIEEMRQEAKNLEEDTFVSLSEGIGNIRIAKYLRKYADEIERFAV